MSPDCKGCGKDLRVDTVSDPSVDWVKVVCSGCGEVNEISMVRLSANS
jgi:transcription elongation factor Elf1